MTPRRAKVPLPGFDALDRAIINRLQEPIPLAPDPFAVIADTLGCSETELLDRASRLRETGIITRFGPFIDAEALGGAFCLCAMSVPADRFDVVAEAVNAFDEVAHNYERDHALNMWFVLATETPAEIDKTAREIERVTGCAVLLLPKLQEYFIGFKVAA